MSFVFGGDTRPNQWFIKYAKKADLVIHECFPTPEGLAAFNDWEIREATYVSSYVHTPPTGFGKVMSEIRPRMAVAFHTVLLPDIQQAMLEGIRETHDGPLTIASDLTVWNVTKDRITTRDACESNARSCFGASTPPHLPLQRGGTRTSLTLCIIKQIDGEGIG